MKKGVSQVIATILMLIITIALAGMAYMYIAGVFIPKVELKEVDCSWLKGYFDYTICEYEEGKVTEFGYLEDVCCCYYQLYNNTYALDRCYEIEEK